jgi:mRNA-degrading endonuclease RelE of RelBE toxin-antitoxin system
MNVELRESFKKDLRKISKDDQLIILKALDEIEQLTSLSESTHIKKIKGQEHFFRYKTGNYRIILQWDKKTQTLIGEVFGQRKDIYKKK